MKANGCAPDRVNNSNDSNDSNNCFTLEELIELVSAYNRYVTKHKLNPNNNQSTDVKYGRPIKIKKDKKYLITELHLRFVNRCNGSDACLLKQEFMKEIVDEMRKHIEENAFMPNGPSSDTEWLSTTDINEIMKKYEKKYKQFTFLGAVPLDCEKYSFCSLYSVDFESIKSSGKTTIGVIYNLDKLGSPGSHWVSMFIDLDNGEINFCDSQGDPPVGNINGLINKFIKWYESTTKKKAVYKYNTKHYQKDKSECGVYSCNFIIRRLSGESFDQIINKSLTFEEINSCRNVYFANNPSKYPVHIMCDQARLR